jgi:hypothetical protein
MGYILTYVMFTVSIAFNIHTLFPGVEYQKTEMNDLPGKSFISLNKLFNYIPDFEQALSC